MSKRNPYIPGERVKEHQDASRLEEKLSREHFAQQERELADFTGDREDADNFADVEEEEDGKEEEEI